jgi:hypothetical protein
LGRSDDRILAGEGHRWIVIVGGWMMLAEPSQTEIQELDAFCSNHQVARLKVAMHDAATMRLIERFSNARGMKKSFTIGQTAALQYRGERLAFQILHDHEGAVAVLAYIVEGANVGVIQTRNGASLGLETSTVFRARRKGRRNRLDRYRAFQSRIHSTVDLAHAAGANQLINFVGAQSCAALQRHRAALYGKGSAL